MEITVEKCEHCGRIFEDSERYHSHIQQVETLRNIESRFPPVKDDGCRFGNGHWNVQRSQQWLEDYKAALVEAISSQYQPFSYAWYRELCDGGSIFYSAAVRVLCVCPTCFIEHGQRYFAGQCIHIVVANLPEGA